MPLNIKPHEIIIIQLIERVWGPECRFTAKDQNGKLYDEVIPVPSMQVSDDDLYRLVEDHLTMIEKIQSSIPENFDIRGIE